MSTYAQQMLDLLSPATRASVLAQVAKDEETAAKRAKLDAYLLTVHPPCTCDYHGAFVPCSLGNENDDGHQGGDEVNAKQVEPTPQQKMQAKLESCGLPYKEIKVYGSQIMVMAWSRTAALRWHSLLFKICTTVRPPGESRDYNKVNKGTCLLPTIHKVWCVWGTI